MGNGEIHAVAPTLLRTHSNGGAKASIEAKTREGPVGNTREKASVVGVYHTFPIDCGRPRDVFQVPCRLLPGIELWSGIQGMQNGSQPFSRLVNSIDWQVRRRWKGVAKERVEGEEITNRAFFSCRPSRARLSGKGEREGQLPCRSCGYTSEIQWFPC